jgi:hypothetical protein
VAPAFCRTSGTTPSARAVRPLITYRWSHEAVSSCPAGPCAGQLRWDRFERLLTLLTAAEGDDERVIDDADGSAGFVGIVAASASTCRSPYERGRPQVVTPGSAAAPLPLLGAARLRYGSVCHRPLWSPRAVCRGWAVVRVAAPITEFGVGVVHSSSSWPLSRRRHRERR